MFSSSAILSPSVSGSLSPSLVTLSPSFSRSLSLSLLSAFSIQQLSYGWFKGRGVAAKAWGKQREEFFFFLIFIEHHLQPASTTFQRRERVCVRDGKHANDSRPELRHGPTDHPAECDTRCYGGTIRVTDCQRREIKDRNRIHGENGLGGDPITLSSGLESTLTVTQL